MGPSGDLNASHHVPPSTTAGDRSGPAAHDLSARAADAARMLGDLACLHAWNGGNTQRVSGESVAISGAVEELARTIDSIASAASATHEQSTEAARIVSETVNQAADAATAIQDIATSFSDIQAQTGLLAGSIRSIADMARDIDSISKQTKLLSLNATIEAARAGEAGLGFGVVAAEVKALSEQTARTTEHISAKLAELDHVIAGMSRAVGSGGERVDSGTRAFKSVSRNMDLVAERVSLADQRIDSISHALHEQKSATTSIAASLTEVARLATQNNTDGKASADLLSEVQATTMALLSALDAGAEHAPLALAAELAVWRGALAQCLVGARSDRAYEHVPLDRLNGLAPAVRSSVDAPLAAIRTAARNMGLKLQEHDVDGAVPFYVTADEQITQVIATLTRSPAAARLS